MPNSPPAARASLSEDDWRDRAKGMMKAELKRQNLTYEDLASRLSRMGIEETEASIRNKISRGTFSFVFALQAFAALEVQLIPFKPQLTAEMHLPPELVQATVAARQGGPA